ncbi:imp-specific 5 -nucleotidase [Niveomyces insectorum RCEF 264]|uniref:IMP-specific 5'-nucleotidase 1 n=1 Tax=Niveomyces insectorum RCEF 264 TaxID=1081102 RepID=A0A162J3N8_9HYPO|nr:imp-specific 5 -nucleotidase [Niveomyces insectorum RCEF 264]
MTILLTPAGDFEAVDAVFASNTAEVRRRYAEIMRDIEAMIEEHRLLQTAQDPRPSRLQLLVPTVGPFFTPLPLEAAFVYQDGRRHISSRRLVAPSFNDVRLTLNTAQLLALAGRATVAETAAAGAPPAIHRTDRLQLVTFDGDLTLYEDGQNLVPDSPLIPRILALLQRDIKVGIVTAAGYDAADKYYERLHGLLQAVHAATDLTDTQKHSLLVVGGEASFVFAYSASAAPAPLLAPIDPAVWMPDAMKAWPAADVAELLDLAETTLRACVERLQLPAQVLRKARAVGIVPLNRRTTVDAGSGWTGNARPADTHALLFLGMNSAARATSSSSSSSRATLEGGHTGSGAGARSGTSVGARTGARTGSTPGQYIKNPRVAQPCTTLHVGDQFLSAGANDFRARRAATTAWVANPAETEALLDELLALLE